MRYLPWLLLWAFLQVWGQSEAQQKNYTFRCLQMSSFANRSWSRTDSVVWLGDLQTHRWSNDSATISFTKPWSQGKLSNQQWEKLQHMFQVYRVSFTRDIQELVKMMSPKEDSTLDVEAGEEAGLACRVKHSSLGGQDIILYWDARQAPVGLIVFIVLIMLVVVGAVVYYIWRRRSAYQDIR
ncbi:antigen-presenting glycoprotein CD1d1 isoform 9 precursor [Mus musculus]|uniref:antigen-presenting glycoprotein CD1d1 isoform 9 precursor n=1 Tax=Mus musculus TaxID=10090 RepID=UPI0020CA373D|nr:antigen-presenting glycoprotein CD1d1 isoform 9 precursor [Mus musculus]